jgi:BASS family bile acid:Na+ symporter
MFVLMLGMGLTLAPSDFRRVWAYPQATLVGTLAQLVGMPVVGCALALAFDLPPMHAAGLVAIAACPGGMFSNLLVYVGKGDVPLSVTLTATATMATLITMPMWLGVILDAVGAGETGVAIPVVGTALRLGGFTVLPIGVGMAVGWRWSELRAWEFWTSRGGLVLLGIGTAMQIAAGSGNLPEHPGASLVPVLCLHGAALAMGYLAPLLLGIPLRQSATIAVEISLKNGLIGLFVVTQSLDTEAALPILFYATLQLPIAGLILLSYRMLSRARDDSGVRTI